MIVGFCCLLTKQEKPINATAITRAMTRNRDLMGVSGATPHDLRRTVTTHMVRLGIQPLVIDKVQNHKEQGIIKHYNHYDYLKEKTEALNIWSNEIDAIVNGKSNIVQFKRKQ